MKIEEEKMADVFEEMKAIVSDHWEEVSEERPGVPLDIDWAQYLVLEKIGLIHLATVRNGEGMLVGYCVSLVTPHLHFRSTTFGLNDSIYIIPEYRKGWIGVKLIAFVLEEMKRRGCFSYVMYVKTGREQLALLMESFKAKKIEYGYEVRLWDSSHP